MNKTISPSSTPSDDQLTLVARLYYVDGLGQAEVARIANVSQTKVSRLLSQAKQRGIVRISVAPYQPRHNALEASLRERLGIREAMVIKSDPDAKGDRLREAIGYFGGRMLEPLLGDCTEIAIAGGRTIREVVEHLSVDQPRSIRTIQAMGHVDATIREFDAQEVGRLMAQRLGGSFVPLNSPAFIPDEQARDVIMELEQVRSVRRQLRDAHLAIVGIGTLENSVFAEHGTLTPEMTRELQAAGAVGEICGRFFNADGQECATRWANRVVSIRFDELRKIPLVLAIACGRDRAAAITAACCGGLISGLLIDEGGARAVLEFAAGAAATVTHSVPPAQGITSR